MAQTYTSSSGDFFLEGDGGSLTWDYISSSLTIQGRISGSSIQGGTIQGSSMVGGEINVPNKMHLYSMLMAPWKHEQKCIDIRSCKP